MQQRSSELLIEALRTHSVEGYPVTVPVLGDAKIVRQGGTAPLRITNLDTRTQQRAAPMPFYVVEPDKPMPFRQYAEARHFATTPWSDAQWNERIDSVRGKGNVILGDEAIRRLKAGESVSQYEAEYEAMYDGGMLDGDGRVVLGTFFPQQVSMPKGSLKKNMLVEFAKSGGKQVLWMGRFLKYEKQGKIALLELFSPIPFVQMEGTVSLDDIKAGYASEYTYSLGYGLAHAWEDARGSLPEGSWSEDEREFLLKDAMPVSEVEKLCEANFPGVNHCVWQALIMYILPVLSDHGVFRPLPENVVSKDFVVTVEDQ
jgi:hypothetical protein